MLRELKIQNFAIIENSELSFAAGMTVLTGETGAGKTIIIDALTLLLGTRANLEMIRYGESKAVIEGVFDAPSDKLNAALARMDIPQEPLLTITRIVQEARSTTRVNGVSVTSKELKDLSLYLLDIHVQHDTMRLFDPSRYLELLDDYAQTDVSDYQSHWTRYHEAIRTYNDFVAMETQAKDQLDYWQFQVQELVDLQLEEGEEARLNEERASLKNFDKIYELLQRATSADADASRLMVESLSAMQKLAAFEVANEDIERAQSAYYDWVDVVDGLKTKLATLQYDPERLDWIESRLQELSRISRKYKCTTDELIEKKTALMKQIHAFEDASATKEQLRRDVKQQFDPLLASATVLHRARSAAALTLQTKLQDEVKELHLPNARFAIHVHATWPTDELDAQVFGDTGVNHVEFDVSTNKGEPLKPLAKVASGGEMSRVMLGLKTVLLEASGLSTIVFDEIDQGVSGAVAQSMAEKLKRLSRSTQVLLITHLPQVAAIANTHLLVQKQEVANRTVSSTVTLDFEARIQAIAEMISPAAVTEKSLALAKEYMERYQ
jgi:DNA repair protein RecN (Recombination protein N)